MWEKEMEKEGRVIMTNNEEMCRTCEWCDCQEPERSSTTYHCNYGSCEGPRCEKCDKPI